MNRYMAAQHLLAQPNEVYLRNSKLDGIIYIATLEVYVLIC